MISKQLAHLLRYCAIACPCLREVGVQRNGYRSKASQIKRSQKRKEVNTKMELNIEATKTNGHSNSNLLITKKSRSVKTGSHLNGHSSIFDPNKYMLKLPKTKKIIGDNGMVKWEKTETDYLPVAARIAWFRREHPLWSIITEVEQLADKAIVMKAIIKDMLGSVIATARKKKPK
jgi:hypothetical protein